MIPGTYNLTLYRGDTYYGPLIELPDLSPFGGPSTLTGATVKAQVRKKPKSETVALEFDVEIVNATTRQLRLHVVPGESDDPKAGDYFWDLEVTAASGWVGTPLAGAVAVVDQVTREVAV